MGFSCSKTEYIEVPVEVPVEVIVGDTLIITVEKDNPGYYGASGYINGIYKEYQGREFGDNLADSTNFFIQIASFEWFQNVIWAHREVIGLINIRNHFQLQDTIFLNSFTEYELGRIYHQYSDGDAGAECYVILEQEGSNSWFVITEHHEEVGEIAGTLHADYVISDICPPKFDPSQPDTIRIRDFWFRSKIRE